METSLFDCSLELDEGGCDQRSDPAILADEQLKVLLRENRLALQRGKTRRKWMDRRNNAVLDIPLRCLAHAHPECCFRWVRLAINFSATPGAIIQALSPDKVMGEEPIKITTKYGGGLSFELDKLKLGPEFNTERSTEQQVYFPEITSEGVGFAFGGWKFEAQEHQDLYVDRDLRLLVSFPANIKSLQASFTLRAKVTAQGIAGKIPLVGRAQANIEISEEID